MELELIYGLLVSSICSGVAQLHTMAPAARSVTAVPGHAFIQGVTAQPMRGFNWQREEEPMTENPENGERTYDLPRYGGQNGTETGTWSPGTSSGDFLDRVKDPSELAQPVEDAQAEFSVLPDDNGMSESEHVVPRGTVARQQNSGSREEELDPPVVIRRSQLRHLVACCSGHETSPQALSGERTSGEISGHPLTVERVLLIDPAHHSARSEHMYLEHQSHDAPNTRSRLHPFGSDVLHSEHLHPRAHHPQDWLPEESGPSEPHSSHSHAGPKHSAQPRTNHWDLRVHDPETVLVNHRPRENIEQGPPPMENTDPYAEGAPHRFHAQRDAQTDRRNELYPNDVQHRAEESPVTSAMQDGTPENPSGIIGSQPEEIANEENDSRGIPATYGNLRENYPAPGGNESQGVLPAETIDAQNVTPAPDSLPESSTVFMRPQGALPEHEKKSPFSSWLWGRMPRTYSGLVDTKPPGTKFAEERDASNHSPPPLSSSESSSGPRNEHSQGAPYGDPKNSPSPFAGGNEFMGDSRNFPTNSGSPAPSRSDSAVVTPRSVGVASQVTALSPDSAHETSPMGTLGSSQSPEAHGDVGARPGSIREHQMPPEPKAPRIESETMPLGGSAKAPPSAPATPLAPPEEESRALRFDSGAASVERHGNSTDGSTKLSKRRDIVQPSQKPNSRKSAALNTANEAPARETIGEPASLVTELGNINSDGYRILKGPQGPLIVLSDYRGPEIRVVGDGTSIDGSGKAKLGSDRPRRAPETVLSGETSQPAMNDMAAAIGGSEKHAAGFAVGQSVKSTHAIGMPGGQSVKLEEWLQ